MTEDEAAELLKQNEYLFDLLKKFQTKQFVIDRINDDYPWVSWGELIRCGIAIDYDIILTKEMHYIKVPSYGEEYIHGLKLRCDDYAKHLTQHEIDKLITTLSLLL